VKEQLSDIALTQGTFKSKLERAIRTIAIEEFAATCDVMYCRQRRHLHYDGQIWK
jgi:hypothetical protein